MNSLNVKLFNLFFIVLLLIPIRTFAGETEYEVDRYTFTAMPRNEEVDKSHITVRDFTIGKHTLKEIQAKFGNTTVLQREENSALQICYRSQIISDGTLIVFETDAMGGWDELTTISIFSKKEEFPKFQQCKMSRLISKKIQTKSGLKLAVNKDNLKTILGKPTKVLDDNVFYIFETKRKMTDAEIRKMALQWPDVATDPYFSVFSYIHVKFNKNKMTYLSVSKVETY